ncbi:MAG: hypothetical protein Q9213_000259 [Squamulea squamosa]
MRSLYISALAVVASLQGVATAPVHESSQQVVFSDHLKSASRIRKSLKKAEIIPDVLDDFTPSFSLNVTYPKSGASVNLGNNIKPSDVSSSPDVLVDSLKDSEAPSSPIVHIEAIGRDDDSSPTPTIRSNVTYTFVLTDPDATSRADPKMAEMCHWIVTDITFGDSSSDHVVHLPLEIQASMAYFQYGELKSRALIADSKPSEIMSYYPPAPPPKTGYHRYVFVLLTPKANTKHIREAAEPKKPKERPHWGYGKVGKGVRAWAADNGLTPVGANFFYARNKKQ